METQRAATVGAQRDAMLAEASTAAHVKKGLPMDSLDGSSLSHVASTPSFDLIRSPWIPVLDLDGTPAQVGIREILGQAQDLREITSTPTEVVGITRMLLAILHRVFGPASAEAWQALWEGGHFEPDVLDAYLRDARFDLLDPTWPVFQTPGISIQQMPASRLAHERAALTDSTLFDKRFDAHDDLLPADAAARALVAFFPFAPGGLVTADDDSDRSSVGGSLVNVVVSLVRGKTLFHTLMLNLVLYDPVSELPFASRNGDRPLWERKDPPVRKTKEPAGYLDWLTYPTRRVLLGPASYRDGTWGVHHVAIMDGERLSPNGSPGLYEQHVPFDKGSAGWKGVRYAPSGLSWRDRLSLMQATRRPNADHRHGVIEHLAGLRREGVTGLPDRVEVDVFGFAANKKAKVGWGHDRFSFPAVYLDNADLFDRLSGAVTLPETTAKLLTQVGASDPLGILAAGIVRSRSPGPAAVVGTTALDTRYWNDLAPAFDELLSSLPRRGDTALMDWVRAISRVTNRVFDAACDQFRGTGAGMAAEARARPVFDQKLGRIIGRYQKEYRLTEERTV